MVGFGVPVELGKSYRVEGGGARKYSEAGPALPLPSSSASTSSSRSAISTSQIAISAAQIAARPPPPSA